MALFFCHAFLVFCGMQSFFLNFCLLCMDSTPSHCLANQKVLHEPVKSEVVVMENKSPTYSFFRSLALLASRPLATYVTYQWTEFLISNVFDFYFPGVLIELGPIPVVLIKGAVGTLLGSGVVDMIYYFLPLRDLKQEKDLSKEPLMKEDGELSPPSDLALILFADAVVVKTGWVQIYARLLHPPVSLVIPVLIPLPWAVPVALPWPFPPGAAPAC